MPFYDPREIPQFVILGIALSGTDRVALIASKKLTDYEIEHKRDEPEFYWELLGPIRHSNWIITLRVRMTEYVVTTAPTYPEAFTALFEHWSPEPDAPARAELPNRTRWDDPAFTEADLREQFAEYGITLPASSRHPGETDQCAYPELPAPELTVPELPIEVTPEQRAETAERIAAARRHWQAHPPELPAGAWNVRDANRYSLGPAPELPAPAESDSEPRSLPARGDGTWQNETAAPGVWVGRELEDAELDELADDAYRDYAELDEDAELDDWRELAPGVWYAPADTPAPRELPPGG